MKNLEKLVNKKTKVFNEKNGSVIFLTDDIKVVTFDNFKNVNGKLVKTNEIGNKDIVLSKLEKIQIKNSIDITEAIKTNIEKIKQASKFVGKDELRPVMNYVYIDKGDVVATDAHILVKYSNCAGLEGINDKFIHPKVVNLLEEAKSIKYTNRFMYAEFQNYYLIATDNGIGKFPNYNAVIPNHFDITDSYLIDKKTILDNSKLIIKDSPIIDITKNLDCENYHNEEVITTFKCKKVGSNFTDNLTILVMGTKKNTNSEYAFNCLHLNKIATVFNANIILNCLNDKALIGLDTNENKPKKVVTNKTNEMEAIIKQMAEKIAQLEAQINNQVVSETVKPVETVKQVETVKPKIEIVDYSEKSIMVYGDTKLIKDKLLNANINARFNPFLKLNGIKTPGWIIASKHKSVVEAIISNCVA
jgi:hypothetical protein